MSPITTLAKTFTFDASHQLPNHDGKCRNLHGHTYRVELLLTGEVKPADGSPDEGMVIDFAHVKAAWKQIEPRLDHRHLNDSLPVAYHPTTAENIAAFIVNELSYLLPQLYGVRLYETPTSCVEVRL